MPFVVEKKTEGEERGGAELLLYPRKIRWIFTKKTLMIHSLLVRCISLFTWQLRRLSKREDRGEDPLLNEAYLDR